MTGRHGRRKSSNDPLYVWKKHSGFKMGLLTDIVMGDEHKFSGSSQYCSTMHADYDGSLATITQGADTQNGKTKHQTRRQGFVPTCPAGKPLGFTSSRKSEMHIVFGDAKMVSDERHASMTDRDFRPPPADTQKPAIVKPGVVVSTQPSSELTSAQMFHSKPPTATSAAHIGLQTRQDLPIDDKHFRSFMTTTQEAYLPKDSSDPSSAKSTASIPRVNMGRPSHIHLGDLEKQKSYDTVHETSYVQHPSSAYRPYLGHLPKSSSILLGHHETNIMSDQSPMYLTTTAATYLGAHKPRDEKPQLFNEKYSVVAQQGGASHIAFGEDDPERRCTQPSVTQHDFVNHGIASQNATRPRTSHHRTSRTSAQSIQPISHSSQTQTQPQLQRGIMKALEPDDNRRDLESYSMSSFKPYIHSESSTIPAAGVFSEYGDCATGGVNALCMNTSSVPTGDARHYDFDSFGTTTASTFSGHKWDGPPVHPILGANITKSKVTFGEPADPFTEEAEDRYRSTTHSTFVKYSAEDAQRVRGVRISPHPSMHTGDDIDLEYAMDRNKTTHQSHFSAPKFATRRRAKLPHLAAKNMLFPLRTTHSYDTTTTTTQDYYGFRDGLVGDQIALKKATSSRESSIVFGDPNHPALRHRQSVLPTVSRAANMPA
eukprot:jgi/Hompol1/606/HPOL_002549-RA